MVPHTSLPREPPGITDETAPAAPEPYIDNTSEDNLVQTQEVESGDVGQGVEGEIEEAVDADTGSVCSESLARETEEDFQMDDDQSYWLAQEEESMLEELDGFDDSAYDVDVGESQIPMVAD